MSNPVSTKWFDSTMTGAPELPGTAGSLIAMLDQVLLSTGFGSVTLSSLVVASGVATATVNTGHGFFDHVVVLIGGSTPSGLNGDKRITKVSATVFTFDATGIADGAAAGTITAKMSPMGWTKAFSGTNKAVYARSSSQSTIPVLRIDDSNAQNALAVMYESMADVNTGTGPAPLAGSVYCQKSSVASSVGRPWRLFADDRLFYLFINNDAATWASGLVFGDINSYREGDEYHCILVGGRSDYLRLYLAPVGDTQNCYLSRWYMNTKGAISSSRYSHARCPSYIGNGGMAELPNMADNCFHCWIIEIWESTTRPRGVLPGCYCPLHSVLTDGQIIYDVPNIGNMLIQMSWDENSRFAMDITGPWR